MADLTQASLLTRVRRHAALTPHKVAVRVLDDDGHERESLSYRALWTSVSNTAHALAARVSPGERVLLLLPTGLDYVVSFLGCLGAGACAVPVHPAQGVASEAQRALAIAQAARPRLAITSSSSRALRRIECVSLHELTRNAHVALTVSDANVPHASAADELALLQYTSGSTSQPKGVMVSHGNLLANQGAIAGAFGMSERDVVVSWLPLHHDMGLLGALLQALYSGCELVLLSPSQFSREPARWLDAITRYRGTVSGGPDFGYRMCLERIGGEALARFDLSSWRLAFTGAEPIRAGTLASFARRFSSCGFRDSALYACYGLAEATLFVSGSTRGRIPIARRFDARALERGVLQPFDEAEHDVDAAAFARPRMQQAVPHIDRGGASAPSCLLSGDSVELPARSTHAHGNEDEDVDVHVHPDGLMNGLRSIDAAAGAADGGVVLVGCGGVAPGHRLLVAAEGGAAVPDGQIGEIWVAGPSVTGGYFEDERATRESFVERDGLRCLRTGDLGAVLDGELFVAGRLKDLIIVRGRKLFPEDIERSIETAISLLQKGRVAAFGEEIAGDEGFAVAVEVSRSAQKLLREDGLVAAICEAVARTHLEAPRRVLLLKPGALPKTSSGKLRRRATATAFRAGTLGAYAHYISGVRQGEPTNDVAAPQVELTLAEQRIAALWKELLGVPIEQPNASFFALGGNSVLAAQLVVRIEHELGVSLPLSDVFAAPSLRSLAERIAKRRASFAPLMPPPAAAGATSQCLALTAAQRSLWLAIERDPQLVAFHLSVAIELRGQLDVPALRCSLQLLMQRHDALRTSIELHGTEPLQRVHHALPAPHIYEADMEPALRAIGRAEALRALVECQVERGFELERGPLWACALARLDDATSCLVLTAHHLVLDSASLEIVLNDLAELYVATCARRAPQLPVPVTVRELLAAEAARAGSHGTGEHVRAVLDAGPLHLELPLDHPRPSMPSHRAERVTWLVPEPLSAELSVLARAEAVPLSVVMLSALSVLLQRHTGAPGVRVGLPLANRHGALASRAVSLCMRTGLLALPVRPGDQLRELLPLVAAQLARMNEQRVLTPELLARACLSGRDAGLPALFEVTFDYRENPQGRLQRLGAAQVLAVETFTGFTPFDLTLEVQAGPHGQLTCQFEYATELFEHSTMQRLASDYASVLATLAFDAHAYVGAVRISSAHDRSTANSDYTDIAISEP